MPAESEYRRTYKQFQLSPPSPDDPLPREPHSIPLSVPAGISSANLGVTQEPPVGRKRKTEVHERKVTFTTDYKEHGSPTKMDNKGLKYRAGYRRPDVKTPTEYQLHYQWPDPPPSEAPLLNAELMLHSSKYPTDPPPVDHERHNVDRGSTGPSGIPANRQSNGGSSRGGVHLPLSGDKDDRNEDIDYGNTHTNIHVGAETGSKVKKDPTNVKKIFGGKQRKESAHHHRHHPRVHHGKHQIQDLLSKQPSDKEKGQSSKLSKKHRKKVIKQFVTEYQRRYCKWPVGDGKRKKKEKCPPMTIPAGVPQMLTDSSGPRLLKHSPLPVNGQMQLLSVYQANFVSPTDCDFVEGVWKGVSPTEHAQEKGSEEPIPSSHSWYNQLLELRHSAEMYKKRAEGVNIARLLPLTRRDVESYRDITPSVTSSDSISCTPSSPTPSDSVSCMGSDDPVHVHTTAPPKPTAPPTHMYKRTRNSGSPYLRDGPPSDVQRRSGMKVQDIEDLSSETLSEISSPSDSVPKHIVDRDSRKNGTIPHSSAQPPIAQSTSDSEGRVQTPNIQRSSSDFKRHHLDLTTPVDGGLFLSPKKSSTEPESVLLPFPRVSPKFRRDMKSRAPITPPPKQTKDECIQVDGDIIDSPQTSQSPPAAKVRSNLLSHKHSQHIPASSSPYHSQCVPGGKDNKSSGSIRKLDFGPHQTVPSAHTRFTASKSIPKSYAHRVEGNAHAQKDNCGICGAHLSTSSTRYSKPARQASSHKSVPKYLSTQNGNRGLGAPTRPQFSAPSVGVPPFSQRPLSSTNYMTRLPTQGGVLDRSRDIDEVSLASLSLSSCSVASDVLKKARDRRDHFWTQPRLAAT